LVSIPDLLFGSGIVWGWRTRVLAARRERLSFVAGLCFAELKMPRLLTSCCPRIASMVEMVARALVFLALSAGASAATVTPQRHFASK
jgi:hypothetical protein